MYVVLQPLESTCFYGLIDPRVRIEGMEQKTSSRLN